MKALFRILVSSVYWRPNLVLGIGFVLIVMGSFFYTRSMSSELIQTMALEEARHYSKILVEFRTLYTREVVEKLRKKGIDAGRDFHGKDNMIPLPATLTKLLGSTTSEPNTSRFKLYSPYPFPNPTTPNVMADPYTHDAWKFLNENPNASFSRIERVGQIPTLRYATADRMRAECVSCHNSHPDSPKTDWGEGDVRGVLEVAVPLTPGVSMMDLRLRDLVAFSVVFLGIVVWVLAATIQKSRMNYLGLLSEREYSDEITGSMTDALIVVDPRGSIATVNQAAISLLGWAEADLVGQPLGKFLAPLKEDSAVLSAEFEVLREAIDQAYGTDYQRLMSELSILPVGMTREQSSSKEIWLNEAFERLTGWDRGTLKPEILQGLNSLDPIEGWGATPISLPCADGSVVTVHRASLPMDGSPGCVFCFYLNDYELRSWPVLNHLILSTIRHFHTQITVAEQLEVDLLTSTGNTVPVLLGGARILGQSMEHQGTVLVAKDMTSIRKSEYEREQIKLQLFAQSKLASLGQVAAGVAHEINNPLTFIKAYLAILETDNQEHQLGSERGVNLLPEATRQVERITKIVRHMQLVGRQSPGKWLRVLLEEVLDNSLVLLQEPVRANSIQIRREIEQDLIGVECCPDLLEQLMTNLLQNAIDSLEEVTRERIVVIRMFHDATRESVVIEFSDNGIGISPTDQQHIFDPFFTTKEVGKGTGLGLSLSYAIAREHHGDLQCQPSLEHGVTMRITLPVHQPSPRPQSS